ncbi:hypothetical protein, partial [Azotobacter vinelandii]|uniref:hypothetical protein n=1 Tax=Azotobacter vinelandii TaxID=354 RepID=UPI001E3A162E
PFLAIILHSFIPSFLHSFIPSFLHSFIPSRDRAACPSGCPPSFPVPSCRLLVSEAILAIPAPPAVRKASWRSPRSPYFSDKDTMTVFGGKTPRSSRRLLRDIR